LEISNLTTTAKFDTEKEKEKTSVSNENKTKRERHEIKQRIQTNCKIKNYTFKRSHVNKRQYLLERTIAWWFSLLFT
jgi:hypothetical protein